MKDEPGKLRLDLDADDLRSLLVLLVQSQGKRISSAVIGGHRVWIKRYDAERRPLAKRLHSLISPLLLYPFLRSPKEVGKQAWPTVKSVRCTLF